MTPIETLALIFSLAIIIKLVVIFVNKNWWVNFTKLVYKNPGILAVVELVLAGVVFYYLIQSLSVVYIVGGVLLGALLTGMTFAAYRKEVIQPMIKLLKSGNALKKAWLPVLVWIALAIWVLLELFYF